MNKKTDACATTRLGLMLRRLGLLPSMIVGLLALPLAAQAASFTGLGDLAGGGFSSAALGVSGDGSVVVGAGISASEQEAVRWTSGGGMVGLGGILPSVAIGASGDWPVVVGSTGSEAVRWTSGGWHGGAGGSHRRVVHQFCFRRLG